MQGGCDPAEIFDLLFAVSYGVKTVVPSLRATAAWLALSRTDIRDEIVDRDPMLLLKEGDPGSLPDDIKSKLLLHLARLHAEGGGTAQQGPRNGRSDSARRIQKGMGW